MNKGKLIILVGGSSAGKTSLGLSLQSKLDDLYLLMGIDLFWFTLPQRQLDLNTVDPQFYSWQTEQQDGKEVFRIVPGPILDDLMIARYYAIAKFLDQGFNVISDDVIWKRLWLDECLKAVDGYDVMFIKVSCSDAVGAQRESERGDRHAGWNRGSAFYSNLDCLYDLEIDTTNDSPDECASKVKAALAGGLKRNAFSAMKLLQNAVLLFLALYFGFTTACPLQAFDGHFPKKGDAKVWEKAMQTYNAGIESEVHRNFDKAIALYEQALLLYPNDADFYDNLAALYAEQKHNVKRAEELYKKGISVEPTDAHIQIRYAGFLFAQKRYDESKQWLKSAQPLAKSISDKHAIASGWKKLRAIEVKK